MKANDKARIEEIEDEIQEKTDKIQALKDEIDNIEGGSLEDEFNDMLDECNQEAKIGSLTYSPSDVLKNCDETAYNIGYGEYTDEKISDINDSISELEDEIAELDEEKADLKGE